MLNSITVMGRLVHEPEFRTTKIGTPVTRFSLACDRDYDRSKTDFFECTAWRQKAEFVSKYFHKGQLVTVQGRMENNPFEKNGEKKNSWGINVEEAYPCEWKKAEDTTTDGFDEIDDDEEELPF